MLGQHVKAVDVEAARYVHLGATSQDVIDTGLMLCTKKALDALLVDLIELEEQLIGLIERHRRTFMPGRTLLQHARPISFGLKAAAWLDEIVRCRKMLEQGAAKSLAVQFGGAVGNLAASGPEGLQILDGLARKLDLMTPELPWHTQRDRVGRLGMDLALLGTALAKMAQDVVLLSRPKSPKSRRTSGAVAAVPPLFLISKTRSRPRKYWPMPSASRLWFRRCSAVLSGL